MPTLNSLTASPMTISPGQTSLIVVDATPDPDRVLTIRGEVVGASPPQTAEVDVTLDNPPLRFVTSGGVAGDILVTCPDGGTLTPVAGQPGKFTFAP